MMLVCLITVINKRGIVNDHVYADTISFAIIYIRILMQEIIEMRYIYTRDINYFLVKNYDRYIVSENQNLSKSR